METPTEKSIKRYHGYNPAFVRKVWAERRKLQPAVLPAKIEVKSLQSIAVETKERRNTRKMRSLVDRLKAIEVPGKPSIRAIIADVAARHGLLDEHIYGDSRGRLVVAARHAAMLMAIKARPDLSLVDIGRIFKRDHTTLLHAMDKAGVTRASLVGDDFLYSRPSPAVRDALSKAGADKQ